MTASVAQQLIAEAEQRGQSVATAESLTGGLVAAAIVAVPGSSAVYRGGVVSYATAVKHELLGVDADLLHERGAVDATVAQQMAERARNVLSIVGVPASIGIATTGVAGPETQDGHPVGEVFVAVATETSTRVERFQFDGGREQIQAQSVAAALELALEVVQES